MEYKQIQSVSNLLLFDATKPKNLKGEINSITNQTNTIKGQIDNTKRDFVAILGIFAAIFMAFEWA
ncbi:hypothetical protein ckin74_08940 [Helicobacter pylori]